MQNLTEQSVQQQNQVICTKEKQRRKKIPTISFGNRRERRTKLPGKPHKVLWY